MDNLKKILCHFWDNYYSTTLVETYGVAHMAILARQLQLKHTINNCETTFRRTPIKNSKCPICYEPLVGHLVKLNCSCKLHCHSHCWSRTVLETQKTCCPVCRTDLCKDPNQEVQEYLDFDFAEMLPETIPKEDFCQGVLDIVNTSTDEQVDQVFAHWKSKEDEVITNPSIQTPFNESRLSAKGNFEQRTGK